MRTLLTERATVRLFDFDLVDAPLGDVVALLASRPAAASFAYIITPNADHFVRVARQREQLLGYYARAGALLLDSRVVRRLGLALGLPVPQVTTGSDLTAELFQHWIAPDEPVTIIGTTSKSVAYLIRKFSLTRVAHYAPAFGFETKPQIIDDCVEFARQHPARFVFLACGAPRQELLAYRMHEAGGLTGVGLCVGAAIDQIGGFERRAPAWIRAAGLEWSWRIAREPKRMGLRYWSNLAIIPALVRERFRLGNAPAA